MSLNIIIIILFLLLMAAIAVFYRNSVLEKLPSEEGESTLLEESSVRVEQGGAPRTAIFLKCIVRVTDRRIIVAQKILFSKKHALRHVISYRETPPEMDIRSTLKKGYINAAIKPEEIKITGTDEGTRIRIDLPSSMLAGKQHITYKTSRPDIYESIRGLSLP